LVDEMISRRNKYLLFVSICLVFLVSTFRYHRQFPELSISPAEKLPPASSQEPPAPPSPQPPQAGEKPKHTFTYKPVPSVVPDPIIDNFPLAAAAHSPRDLPPIPPWNTPPAEHVRENTPLFIGFTRNWRILQQVVVSYITAGWPPEDIYVVENTGVFDSNAKGLLCLQNPFFLNHTRLHLLGVNIIVTPTLLTFAQLQNFYIHQSIERGWKQYFWGHMDIVALSFEDKFVVGGEEKAGNEQEKVEGGAGTDGDVKKNDEEVGKYKDFKSLYMNCVQALREATVKDEGSDEERRWAMRWFNYDKLALVNVAGFVEIGAWDTQIPYYMTDCDLHARLNMAKLEIKDAPAGFLIDVGESIDDLYTLYRKSDSPPATFVDPKTFEKEKKEKKDSRAADTEESSKANLPTSASKEAWYTHLLSPAPPSSSSPHHPPNTSWRVPTDPINSPSFANLLHTAEAMQHSKATGSKGRNMWQARQRGGEGDPFYRDAMGFEKGILMAIEHGRQVYAEKWGHRGCDIFDLGLGLEDAWRVEKDW